MRKLLTIALLCLLWGSCQKADDGLQSPNGEFTVSYNPQGGFSIQYHGGHMAVFFESALQHLADRPKGYKQQAEEVQTLIQQLPTTWTDTKLLSGYPSEHIVIARKDREGWYIAGLNGTEEVKTLDVDLSFIQEPIESIQLFSDAEEGRQMKIENRPAEQKKLNIKCQPRGGFVIRVK